ncbi:MAG: hypothetical protein LAN62_02925 [Acidobacteriia bacterium]|nr:hypothetical protein [Terriglobia bacterium]
MSASLMGLGYFVETRLKLREGSKEILELDVVATPTGAAGPARQLFEAKKDAFSFPNVFKLFGQRTYLNIGTASLVGLYSPDPLHFPVYEAKGAELGIKVCNYALESPFDRLATPANNLSEQQRGRVIAAAWYQQIAKRIREADFFDECKKRPNEECLAQARNYIFNVRASFFQKTALARAEALYNSYLASPRLSGAAIGQVAREAGVSERHAWNMVNDTDRWPWVQALMQTETTARLTIVKNALDDVVERGALPPPGTVLRLGSLTLNVPLNALPRSFFDGLSVVRDHPHALRLPYLFQAFADLLGGFIVLHDDEELAFIEALTGVPRTDVVDCVKILDEFFAPEGGTFFFVQKDEVLCMKMTPATVRGGGAFLRRIVFGIDDYAKRYPHMGWLIGKWHNTLYQLLEPHLERET